MSAHRIAIRSALAQIAQENGLDLRRQSDVNFAINALCTGLRHRGSRACIAAVASVAKKSPAAQACRIRSERRVAS